MKKTQAQPQIRPTLKIKIPQTLPQTQKKSQHDHKFFSTLAEPPIITKKEMLFEAMGIEKSSRRLMESRRGPVSGREEKGNVQIKIVKEFQARSQEGKTLRRSGSGEMFKIKMSGAGFRKRGKSVSSMKPSVSRENTKTPIKPVTSLQQYRTKVEDESDQLDIIKAYYSAYVNINDDTKMKHEKSERMNQTPLSVLAIETPDKKMMELEISPPIIRSSNNASLLKIPHKINIEEFQKKKIIKNIIEQALTFSDIQNEEEQIGRYEQKFKKTGFGVTHDLSKFDIQSLQDPQGVQFIKKYVNKSAECPYFQNQSYSWIPVLVTGFDPATNRAIIQKQGQKKQRRVSRLSIKLKEQSKSYWQRINDAKSLRDAYRQEMRYLRYVDGRDETDDVLGFFGAGSLVELLPKEKIRMVQNECHNRYYRTFIIYWQMFKNYEPFQKLGLSYRSFNPPKRPQLPPKSPTFSTCLQTLSKTHYTSIKNLPQTLQKQIKKILQETSLSLFHPIISANSCVDLDTFVRSCCGCIEQGVGKLVKQVREVLVAEIVYKMRFSFGAEERPVLKVVRGNDKELERRYFRLCNLMFRDLVRIHYFQKNYQSLCQYLQKFTKWTPDRPPPIITLSIQIPQKQKHFLCQPTHLQCTTKLYSILQYLQKSINSVPDLTSDLLYEKVRYIEVRLQGRAKGRIWDVVEEGYRLVQGYLGSNFGYLRYLGNIGFKREEFSRDGIQAYRKLLTQMSIDLQQILHYSLNTSCFLQISLTPSKTTLSSSLSTTRSRLLRQIQKQLLQKIQQMYSQLQQMSESLKQIPSQQVSYVGMKKYVNVQCQNLLDWSRDVYQLCGGFYQVLGQFGYNGRWRDWEGFVESLGEIVVAGRKVDAKKLQLMEIQKKLLQQINQQRQQLQKSIQTCKTTIQQITTLKKLHEYKPNYTQTSKLHLTLTESTQKLSNINHRQQLLQQELSIFPWVDRLIRRLQPYYQMWGHVYSYMMDSQEWYELPIQELKFEEVRGKVGGYLREFGRLGRVFRDLGNGDAMMICQGAGELVKKIQEQFWVIDSFTKEGLLKKPNMMSAILNQVYGADAPDNFRNVNLQDLLTHNLPQHKTFITKTSTHAQKIHTLQKRISTIIHQLKLHYLQLTQKHGLPYIEPQLLTLLTMSTRQQLNMMDVIKSEEGAADIMKRINQVYGKICTIEHTLGVVGKFLGGFFRVFGVFLVGEIANDLGEDKKKVNQVTRAWTMIAKHFSKDLQLWEAIDSDSHKHRLQTCMKTLAEVEESLRKYLSQKRKIFPRLFFLNDNQLIQLISNQNLAIPTPLLQYLFSGSIKFLTKSQQQGKKTSIMGLQGPFNDRLTFKKSINSTIILWDRLKLIHEQILESMQKECSPIGVQNSKILIIKVYEKVLKWTLKVEEFMRKLQKENYSFGKFYGEYYKEEVEGQAFGGSRADVGALYRWYCLKSVGMMLVEFVSRIGKEQGISVTSFQWQKYLRIYFISQKLTIKTMSQTLPLNHQYISCECQELINLFATPLSNLHTVLTLMRIHMGSNSASPSNIQQTMRSISMLTLSHYVEWNLGAGVEGSEGSEGIGMGMEEIGNVLRGFFVEIVFGLVGARVGEIGVGVLSVLAEVVYDVRQALITREHISILGTQTKWNHNNNIYFNLQLSLPPPSTPTHHQSTLSLCFRQITLRTLPWTTFIKHSISSLITDLDQDTLSSLFKILEELMVDDRACFELNYRKFLGQFLQELLLKWGEEKEDREGLGIGIGMEEFLGRFGKEIGRWVSAGVYEEFQVKIKEIFNKQEQSNNKSEFKLKQVEEQIRQFAQILQFQNKRIGYRENGVNMIAVVGPVQSGKTHLIESALQHLNISKQQIMECQSLTAFFSQHPYQPTPTYLILHSLSTTPNNPIHLQYLPKSHLLPPKTTLIFQCSSLQHIDPSPLTIYNKYPNNSWHRVMWKLLKKCLGGQSAVIEEFSRQMGIFVRVVLYRVVGCSGRYYMSDTWMWESQDRRKDGQGLGLGIGLGGKNVVEEIWRLESVFIRIAQNWVKAVTALVLEGRAVETDLTSIRETVFIALIWVAKYDIQQLLQIGIEQHQKNKRHQHSSSPLLQIPQNPTPQSVLPLFLTTLLTQIESTFLHLPKPPTTTITTTTTTITMKQQMTNPYNYCYDIEKKAWLEWTVVDQVKEYFREFYQTYQEIYLPVRETVAALYFCQYVGKYWDYLVRAEEGGCGATRVVRKVLQHKQKISNKNKQTIQSNTQLSDTKNQPRPKSQPPQSPKPTQSQTILQHYSFPYCSPQLLTSTLQKIYTSQQKNNSLSPYRNHHLHLLIDDLHLPQTDHHHQTLQLLTSLTLHRKQIHSNTKLNNLHMIYISNWLGRDGGGGGGERSEGLDRLLGNVVQIYFRGICDESKRSIFSYILDWFFGNTDQPFSKEVRAMQGVLVQLSIEVSKKYHELVKKSSHNNYQYLRMGSLKTLINIFNFICQVNPRKTKKQKDILDTWAYQFNTMGPGLSWQNYFQIYQSLNLKSPPIPQQQFLASIQSIIKSPGQQKIQQKCFMLQSKNSLGVTEYNLYGFGEVQKIILGRLKEEKEGLFGGLIFYEGFVVEIVAVMRVLVVKRLNLLKVQVPYSGTKTALKCAMFITNGHCQLNLVQYNSKSGWKKDLITHLTNLSKSPPQPSYLTFTINLPHPSSSPSPSPMSQQYLQTIYEYLQHNESKQMIYIQPNPKDIDDGGEEDKQPETLLECLGIHSCFSQKYRMFGDYCRHWVRIVVVVGVGDGGFKGVMERMPELIKYCGIVQQPSQFANIQGIIRHSLATIYPNPNQTSLLTTLTNLHTQTLSTLPLHVSKKQGVIEWMRCTLQYYKNATKKYEDMTQYLRSLLKKKEEIQAEKGKLEKELGIMLPKFQKVRGRNLGIFGEVGDQEKVYLQKKEIYESQAQIVQMKRKKTNDIQLECQQQLGKVTPMLQSAQQSLQKVTRDDINQLRSFPNPPLSAVKVVQALCFVFNEDHLVKEKVENGNKFKDYWDYAKKFILNDRLLKRVTEFKPDFIKNLNRNKMEVLKVIIRQPEFKEERVFKASSAAGNLSVWMRAVVLTFQVMQVIDPKRKLLSQTLESLQQAQQNLLQLHQQMQTEHTEYLRRQSTYNTQLQIQNEMLDKINHIKSVIKRSQQFLVMLGRMEGLWMKDIQVGIPGKVEKAKEDAVFLGLYLGYLGKLGDKDRREVRGKIEKAMAGMKGFVLTQSQIITDYTSIFLNYPPVESPKQPTQPQPQPIQIRQSNPNLLPQPQPQPSPILSKPHLNITSPYYCQNLIILFQKLKTNDNNLIILDQTQTFTQILIEHLPAFCGKFRNIRVVDCLDLGAEREIYGRIGIDGGDKEEEEDGDDGDEGKQLLNVSQRSLKQLVIIENLQLLTICSQFIQYCQGEFQKSRILIIFHHPPKNSLNIPLSITNHLTPQTKLSIFSSLISPITKHSSHLHSKLQQHQHIQKLQQHYTSMMGILLKGKNILVDDLMVKEWVENYEEYWRMREGMIGGKNQGKGVVREIGQIQGEVVKMLGDSLYWQDYMEFGEFVAIVANSDKDNIYSLNQRLKQIFQTSSKKPTLSHKPLKQPPNPNHNPNHPQILPFTPFHFISLNLQTTTTMNPLSQFLQSQKQHIAPDPRSLLGSSSGGSGTERVLYFPSPGRVWDSLGKVLEDGRVVVICCDSVFEGFGVYKRVQEVYEKFCRKMEDTDDDFTREGFGFRAKILITNGQTMIKNSRWRVQKWQPSINTEQPPKKTPPQLKKITGSMLKPQKIYTQKLLTETHNHNELISKTFKQFSNVAKESKQVGGSVYGKWEDLQTG